MSQADLNRLRDDLETVKRAAGVGLPFGREDVRASLWCALCGVLVSTWALLGPWEYRWVVAIPLALAALGGVRAYRRAHRERGAEPVRWREHRLAGAAALVAVPLALAYMLWERQVGVPRQFIGAASVFFLGVGLLIFAVLDRRRRPYAGGAIPLMAFAAAIPLCSPAQVVIAAGLCWAAGGIATAGLQAWQLRRNANDHDTH
jgi:hypothetical protein